MRVLIVDDHEIVRQCIRSLLAKQQDCFVCGEAADGLEAVEKARTLRPDLVLMDLSMPRMDGATATRMIRQEIPESQVIIMSQNDVVLLRRQAAEVGAYGYVCKANLASDLMPAILGASYGQRGGEQVKVGPNGNAVAPNQKRVDLSAGGGNMAELIQSTDWSSTPLGPPETWSPTLRMMVPLLLANRFPQLLWWGPQFCSLYNNAYVPILGAKHPWAIGRPVSEVWAEIWHILKPLIETPFRGGPATWMEDIPLEINRRGFIEETHFTVAYSPVPDETMPGGIGGVLATVHEITEKIIGERRVAALRDLGARSAHPKSAPEACIAAAEALARYPKDVPFAVFYLLDADRQTAQLAAGAGVDLNDTGCPNRIDLTSEIATSLWPIATALATGEIQAVNSIESKFRRVPEGPWSDPPITGAVVPIPSQIPLQFSGFIILGISSRLQFDESYRNFLELMSTQISASISNACAYEEERKRAEALAEIDRAKTAFFSNVSHEFRTPLTLMMGPLEDAIAQAEQLPAATLEPLLLARRNSMRLLKLVNTLLDFSRIEAGRIQASYEPTDLCALTKELASVFRSAIERAGLRLIVNCAHISEPVYVDREMWEKIVLNLLSNAFKFTFAGEIEVSLAEVRGAVELAIRDTGTGIPEKELPRLFERFYRVEGAHGRTFEGSGIGLALVQELVGLHRGEVSAESKMGCGSTFRVLIRLGKDHLPAERIGAPRSLASTGFSNEAYLQEALRWLPNTAEAAEELPSAPLPLSVESPSQPARSAETPRILLADDNADMREYLQRLLKDHYEVTAVPDGRAALEAARRNPPDLVLTDVMMPQLDGFSLLREIRNDPALKSTPVILLSGRAGEESRIEGLQSGADDYLVKPFSARELLARVASHLNIARIRREAADRERKLHAQAELERDRVSNLFVQAPAPLCLMSGPQHRFTFTNLEFLKVTGRRRVEDIFGKTVREAFPEIAAQGFADLLDQVYRTGIPHGENETKVIFQPADAPPRECYLNFVFQPIRGIDGNVEGILAHGVELTEQVLARQRIERSEERLLLSQAAAHIGTWEWDASGDTRTLSPELYSIFGTDANDPAHVEKWIANLHPEDREDVFRQMRDGYTSGEMDFEYRYCHPQLGVRWLYCKGRRVRQESRMFGIVLDITERKHAEGALRQSEQRFRALVNATSYVVYRMSPDWTEMRQLEGRNFISDTHQPNANWLNEYIHPDDQPLVVEAIQEAVRTKSPFQLEHRVRRVDGTLGWTFSRAVPVMDANGEIMEWFGAASDVTARRLAEENYRHLAETLETEVGLRTHELQQRNAEILRQSEQLRELSWQLFRTQDEERRHIARELHDSAGQLLAALSMSLGGLMESTTRQAPELAQSVEQADRLLQQLTSEIRTTSYLLHPPLLDEIGLEGALPWYIDGLKQRSGLQIDLNVSEDVGRLPRDMELVVFRMVQECLTNIHRHSGSKTAVINVTRDPDKVLVEVCDQGKGIPPEKLAEIQTKGSGVGIRGMRERLRQFDGAMVIESTARGTTVRVAIPLVSTSALLAGTIRPDLSIPLPSKPISQKVHPAS